jgi:hypothetical protein
VCGVAALVMLAADLLLARPGNLFLVALGGLVVFLVGFGAIAADALPWRTVPFLCSLAATLLAPLAVLRLTSGAAVGLAVLVLYGVGELSARGRLRPTG